MIKIDEIPTNNDDFTSVYITIGILIVLLAVGFLLQRLESKTTSVSDRYVKLIALTNILALVAFCAMIIAMLVSTQPKESQETRDTIRSWVKKDYNLDITDDQAHDIYESVAGLSPFNGISTLAIGQDGQEILIKPKITDNEYLYLNIVDKDKTDKSSDYANWPGLSEQYKKFLDENG